MPSELQPLYDEVRRLRPDPLPEAHLRLGTGGWSLYGGGKPVLSSAHPDSVAAILATIRGKYPLQPTQREEQSDA